MTTKYIAGTYASGYALNPSYDKLVIRSTGSVAGLGVTASAFATVQNYGSITTVYPSYGIDLQQGGVVFNGSATHTGAYIAGGINAEAAANVTNYGSIAGFVGVFLQAGGSVTNGSATDTAATIGAYGVGVFDEYGSVANFGTIGGIDDHGVILIDGKLVNGSATDTTALILGYHASTVGSFGADTVTNFGTIQSVGYRSVAFYGPGGRLIAEAGSDFIGDVMGDSGATLELAGGTGTISDLGAAGALSGAIAMNFYGFGAYQTDAGGHWTLTGADTLASGKVLINKGSLTNNGTLAVGGYLLNQGMITAGAGNGVDLSAGGSIVNSAGALISGAVGIDVGAGGGATVTTSGTIDGTGGTAVQFGSSKDRLIVKAGATFVGDVVGGGGALQLAGGSGTITGLGGDGVISGALSMDFSGFGKYGLNGGGTWTLSGYNTLSSHQLFRNNGDLVGDGVLTTNGKVLNGQGGVINADGAVLLIDETGTALINNLALMEATDGGALLIEGSTIHNAGTLAAIGSDVVVEASVRGPGSAVVNGGTLTFGSAFNEAVAFTGTTGELQLAQSLSYRGTISGFSTDGGMSLDLGDIGYVSPNQATFSGTTSGGVLTVVDEVYTATIKLVGDYIGSTWVTSSDGGTGVSIVAQNAIAPASGTRPSPHAFASAAAAMAPAHAATHATAESWRAPPPTLIAPRPQLA